MRHVLIALLLIPLSALSVLAAPVKARPYTGIGLLVIGPAVSPDPGTTPALILYRDPGIGRIAELSFGAPPLLSRVITLPSGEYPVAVLGKKGTWLKIAYDEAGREGWLEPERSWNFTPWREFLPGHSARLLPGLKKPYYVVRQQPADTAGEVASLSLEVTFRILEIKENWARVESPAVSGWLRWQDSDGRFLISTSGRDLQQNR